MEEITTISTHFDNRRRQSSFRKFVYASLRISHKKKVRGTLDALTEEPIYRVESIDNVMTVHRPIRDEFHAVFLPARPVIPTECSLVQFFPKDGKSYDANCKLTSFKRKWRVHQCSSNPSHTQLLCPLQATQIELFFKLQLPKDVLLRIISPNGDVSSVLRPTCSEPVMFNPTKVGCGHGKWIVEIATRDGIRFRLCNREEIVLKGQGCLTYEIDHKFRLRLVEQLWLNFC